MDVETTGGTAIVVICSDVHERIRRWHVQTHAPGLPPHITLMFPFKPLEEITDADLSLLRDVFAQEPIEPVSFARTGRFPEVLFLEPEDDARFRRLTDQLTELWPEHPPYGGAFDDVIPHLTVTQGAAEEELDAIERELAPHLPLVTTPPEAWLMTFDGDEWSCEVRFAFQG